VPAEVRGPEEEVHLRLRREAIDTALARIPERHRRVLRLRYGIDDDQPRSITAVAEQLGMSWPAVRKVETEASPSSARHASSTPCAKPHRASSASSRSVRGGGRGRHGRAGSDREP
jgi:hypothetical protein